MSEGLVSDAVSRTLKNEMMAGVSGRTIQRWAKRFGDLIAAFIETLKMPHGIEVMSVDEKYFKSQGKGRYLFETMCFQTRYSPVIK